MKTRVFVSVVVFILASILNASSKWHIKTGMTVSEFRTVDSEVRNGLILGIGKEWRISNAISISGETMYVVRGSIIKDKEIGYSGTRDLYMDDIYFSMGFIEIQTLFRYSFPISKGLKMTFMTGPSLSLAIRDYSDLRNQRFIKSLDYPHDYDFDYYWYDSDFWSSAPSSGFGFHVGFGFKYSRFSWECRYYWAKAEIDNAAEVSLHERMHSLYLLLSIDL